MARSFGRLIRQRELESSSLHCFVNARLFSQRLVLYDINFVSIVRSLLPFLFGSFSLSLKYFFRAPLLNFRFSRAYDVSTFDILKLTLFVCDMRQQIKVNEHKKTASAAATTAITNTQHTTIYRMHTIYPYTSTNARTKCKHSSWIIMWQAAASSALRELTYLRFGIRTVGLIF